jgi:MFS family permease
MIRDNNVLATKRQPWHKSRHSAIVWQAQFNRPVWGKSMMAKAQRAGDSPYTKKQITMALASIILVYFIYSYVLQTWNVAAPKIAAALDGMALYSWSVSIPSLGLAIGTLLAGKFSDIYGRRAITLASVAVFLLGAILSATSQTFVGLIAARTVLCLGQGTLAPLCFAVVGDLFVGGERSKWIGLLNIPFAIPALLGPTLSGWLVDGLGWRHIFWWIAPVAVLCIILLLGMPALIQGAAPKIDVKGLILATIASSALIFGLSFAGTTYPWGSVQVVGLLAIAVLAGLLFLKAESAAAEPILDIEVLRNRPFLTAAFAGFLSFFGMMGTTLYYPLMMQGIQGVSAMVSGQVVTPLGVLMSVIGIPTGFLLARTKSYKWMYVVGYAMVTIVMWSMVFFNANTPIFWGVLVCTLAGIGLGAFPTINTVVTQAAVPRRLLGTATGALFFSISMGMAIAPAILGSAMNIRYNSALEISLPAALTRFADEATMTSLGNPRVLLSEPAMNTLKETLARREGGEELFGQTVQAIRTSMEAGLKTVFFIAAATMLLAFFLIITIPRISLEPKAEEASASAPAKAAG